MKVLRNGKNLEVAVTLGRVPYPIRNALPSRIKMTSKRRACSVDGVSG